MLPADKKKRTHSGSRSKSRKYRGCEYSVDLRNKYPSSEHTKVKTQNSCSLNKSRPSRKNSTKQKKHTKSNNKDSKDPASHSVSADRRHSIMKANRTEANFEAQDFDLAIDQLILGLRTIPQPPCLNAKLMSKYFSDMRKYFSGLDGPFHRLCLQLHTFYLNPMQKFLELVSPMQEAIRRKEDVAKQIDRQIIQNEELYSKLEPIDIEIFKMKEKIEQNRALIEQRRIARKDSKSQEKQHHQEEPHVHFEETPPSETQEQRYARAEPVGRGFRLDLNNIGQLGHMGYHQEFYSNLQEFSQSWREQALREKRF